ncbi:M16 family metallopeptidase [Kitasatospora sp. NPDC087861]|uniref:M16 family metallopeptidase n=1 Tax=Kitasatospora sp. NPDC087861 TaxID=3364070 RepID=UPI0037F81191
MSPLLHRPLLNREQLDNGLRVSVEPRPGHGRGLVAVALTVAAGSDEDPAGRHGTAHLVEHLMFPRGGGADGGDGHAARVAGAGGVCNAETHRDRTVFHTVAPAGMLDDLLGWEARRLEEFAPEEAVLRTETEVIAEEIRGGAASGRLWQTVLGALRPGSRDSYGTAGELAETTPAEVEAFVRRHYRPGAMALSVVGEVEPQRALERIREAFGGLPPGPSATMDGGPPARAPETVTAALPWAAEAVTAALPWAADAVAVGHLLPAPARDLPGHLAQVVLAELVGRGRLPALVRRDPRLTTARVTCGLYGQWLGANAPEPVLAVLGRAPGVRAEEAAEAWTDVLRDLARRPPEAAELRRAVNALLLAWHRGEDSLTARAVTHGHHDLFLPGSGGPAALPDALRRTTPDGVAAAARALLAGPRSLTVLDG